MRDRLGWEHSRGERDVTRVNTRTVVLLTVCAIGALRAEAGQPAEPQSPAAPLRSLGLADYPEFYLELAVERDPLNTAFRFRPQFLYIRKPRLKVQPGKGFDLNITLAFSLPGAVAPFAKK